MVALGHVIWPTSRYIWDMLVGWTLGTVKTRWSRLSRSPTAGPLPCVCVCGVFRMCTVHAGVACLHFPRNSRV